MPERETELDTHADPAVAICARELVKRYGARTVLHGLNLDIRQGTLFGFLGPNGAGKSTTIACLTGLVDATSGDVSVLGEPLTARAAALKLRIGVMPEGLALFDDLYAPEFLVLVGRMFGLDHATARSRVDELLAVLELAGAGRTRLADFSTGMRKKVAFAAAILHRPEVLFLDEPFDGIDPPGVALLKRWLRRFASRGGTVFMTSHVLETVESFCHEVAILNRGRLVWSGSMDRRAEGYRCADRTFATLEELFLEVVGGAGDMPDWL